jgi:hypothetical protein
MAFVRVKPGNWAVGEQLTSAQMNTLDIDHANALDKSSAGDQIAGLITFTGTGQMQANRITAIQATAATAIQSLIAGGISSNAVGGIALNGGANDWPTFPARGHAYVVTPQSLGPLPTGWGSNGTEFLGPASGTAIVWLIPSLHTGATLTNVGVSFLVVGPHSAVPASLASGTGPTLQVKRISAAIGAPDTVVDLSTVPIQGPATPGSGAAWDNGGNVQAFSYACNQNNVIDTTQFRYYAILVDENGANSVANNRYIALGLSLNSITDMHFA